MKGHGIKITLSWLRASYQVKLDPKGTEALERNCDDPAPFSYFDRGSALLEE